MKRSAFVPPILAAALLSTGCVAKKDHEALQAQLAACEAEQVELEASVVAWEERFDRASTRWNDLESSVSEAVPKALEELHSERERIVELVPEQVRSEVADYLDSYFATVRKSFQRLSDQNAEIKRELEATRRAVDLVGTDTKAIGESIDTTVAEERSLREAERARRDRVAEYLSEIVDQVVEFDQTRVNCKQCPERIKFNRKEREAILAFHAELMSDLADLQRFAAE